LSVSVVIFRSFCVTIIGVSLGTPSSLSFNTALQEQHV
jgi:hypothetical protein